MTVTEAPELSTSVGIFASVTSGAMASEVGVMPMPISADLLIDDHVLHDAAGIVGNAAIVAHGELDAPPGDIGRRVAQRKA